jgi:hypothetical protein
MERLLLFGLDMDVDMDDLGGGEFRLPLRRYFGRGLFVDLNKPR